DPPRPGRRAVRRPQHDPPRRRSGAAEAAARDPSRPGRDGRPRARSGVTTMMRPAFRRPVSARGPRRVRAWIGLLCAAGIVASVHAATVKQDGEAPFRRSGPRPAYTGLQHVQELSLEGEREDAAVARVFVAYGPPLV